MRLVVSVPVLSVQMLFAPPIVSHAKEGNVRNIETLFLTGEVANKVVLRLHLAHRVGKRDRDGQRKTLWHRNDDNCNSDDDIINNLLRKHMIEYLLLFSDKLSPFIILIKDLHEWSIFHRPDG